MKMGKEVDPSDVGKHPDLIRRAQAEMTRSDILVCGRCHCVFHFIEEFSEHKNDGCNDSSPLRDNRETKPKVWAFLLWKTSQANISKGDAAQNSWKMYQTWVKLDEAIRETWIVAGRTIQSFARMGQGNLQEMPVKITKTVVDTSSDVEKKTPARVANYSRPIVASTPLRTPLNKSVEKKDENNASFESVKSPISTPVDTPKIIAKKPVNRPPLTKLPANPAVTAKVAVSRLALKSTPNTDESEQHTIEKILAKRFNPRRREHEYLIKWESFTHEQNTWEPQSNLATCPQLLETFEKQLARQKEQRAALAAKAAAAEAEAAQKAQQQTAPTHDADGLPVSPVRPGRSSKSKAMDQVKQWCADNEEEAQKKRKASEGDFDASATDEDITLGAPPTKSVRREPPAVAQAIQRAGQSGVRIVPVNKPAVIAPASSVPKVNGLNMKSPEKIEIAAQNVNINKQTGIVKKPGGVQIAVVKASEAQVRVVQKGDATSSGVVRISAVNSGIQQSVALSTLTTTTQSPAQSQFSRVVQRTATGTTVKSIPSTGSTIIRQAIAPKQPNPNTKAGIAARAPPPNITTTIRSQPFQHTTNIKQGTPQSRVQQQNQRTSISPSQTPKATTISRVTKPAAKPVTSQEDKLAALQRHGDLKITRKQLPQQNAKLQKTIKQQPDESEYSHHDPFGGSDLSLCPITGKVLGQNDQPIDVKVNTLKMEQQQEHLQQQQLQQEGAGLMSLDDGTGAGEIQQMMVNEDGSPILVTGEDGTVYQVAGKNEQGQTILIAQGSDGEQQCVYVTSEESEDPASILGGDMQDASAALLSLDQHHSHADQGHHQQQQEFVIKPEEASHHSVDATQPLAIATDTDSQDGQITAEVVQADLPSPGGTRRVVLLLPDGSFMMTEVSDEQYQALNLVA